MRYYILNMEQLIHIQDLQQTVFKANEAETRDRPPACQLLYFLSGAARVTVDGDAADAARDSLVFLPAQLPYKIENGDTETAVIRINFLAPNAGGVNRLCSDNEYIEHLQYYAFAYIQESWAHIPLFIKPSVGIKYRRSVDQINNDHYDATPGSNLTAACGLHRLLARISADNAAACLSLNASAVGGSPLVQEICEFLNNRYMQKITLTKLSERFHLSPNYLCSVFKETTGFPVIEYLNARRVEAAKQYLATTDCRVRDVARAVGVPDEFYFSRLFKRITGDTPTAFRRKFGVSP